MWFARLGVAAALLATACLDNSLPETPTTPGPAELLAARPYTLISPAMPISAPAPLVLLLHGYGGSSADVLSYVRLDALQATRAFHLALPAAARDALGVASWSLSSKRPPWDVAYLSAIIADVSARVAVDPARVYVVGFSQGAHLAHRMACEASDLVAAIVSLAGQVNTLPVNCQPARPVSVLQVHGTADPVIGYDGDVQGNDPTIPSAHETVGVWARNDGCPGAIADTGERLDLDEGLPGAETKVEAYASCPAGRSVVLWSVEGGGHRLITPAADVPARLMDFLQANAR